jgi:hypothetical protein
MAAAVEVELIRQLVRVQPAAAVEVVMEGLGHPLLSQEHQLLTLAEVEVDALMGQRLQAQAVLVAALMAAKAQYHRMLLLTLVAAVVAAVNLEGLVFQQAQAAPVS